MDHRNEIAVLRERIDVSPNSGGSDAIKFASLDLIATCLDKTPKPLDNWQKAYFAYSMSEIAISSRLRNGLTCLEKAMMPPEYRSVEGLANNKQIAAITLDGLRAYVRELGGCSGHLHL